MPRGELARMEEETTRVYGDQLAVKQRRKRKRKAKTKKLKKAKKKKSEVVPFLLSSLSLLYSVDIYMELVWVALVYQFSFVKMCGKSIFGMFCREH
jgi:hypothetical protein